MLAQGGDKPVSVFWRAGVYQDGAVSQKEIALLMDSGNVMTLMATVYLLSSK